jgi:hypothetical protein
MLPSSGGMAAARGGFSWITALVAAGLVVLVGGGVILVKAIAQSRNNATAESGEKLEASQPTRPAWVDDTFFRENDRLLFVGHSTLVGDKADGFNEADAGAMEEIVNQIGLSIRDPAWIDQVRSQYEAFRAKAIGDLEKATVSGDPAELERARRATRDGRKRVSESFKKTAGPLAPSERNDLYWEKLQTRDGIKYKVSIRYAVPKVNFEKLVETYATPEAAMGAKAVSYFPELAWRFDVTEGAVITHVANDSSVRFAGIQEGDLVLAGMDRVVHDARSWKRVLDEESAALTREGGTLVLKVKRGDAPAIDTRLRIARGGAASADASNKLHQTHEHHSSSSSSTKGKNQTGNIWDDNPEE